MSDDKLMKAYAAAMVSAADAIFEAIGVEPELEELQVVERKLDQLESLARRLRIQIDNIKIQNQKR